MSDDTMSDTLQVVFLIDENVSRNFDGISKEEAAKNISLCVLRMLSYFNDTFSTFQWGYKLYNSISLTHHYERHSFKDFNCEEFEHLEKKLCDRFEGSQSRTSAINQQQRTTSSKCLSCALTDVLHDFQWENNDINSPLRTRRSKATRRKQNILFLLSSCPKTSQELDDFIGSDRNVVESVQNAMISGVLVKEFVETYGIDLFWVDTTFSRSIVDFQVIDMIKGLLQKMNGTIIPFQSLVATSNSLSQSKDPLVPVTSVMNHYLKLTNQQPELVAIDFNKYAVNDGMMVGLLCSTGKQTTAHCILQLTPMLPATSNTQNNTIVNLHPESLLTISHSSDSVTCHTIHMSHNTSNSQSLKSSPSHNVFWIKGVVKRESVCPTWFHLTKVYSCVAMVPKGTKDSVAMTSKVLKDDVAMVPNNELSGDDEISGWFQRLLLSLSQRNLLLVMEIKDPVCDLPVMSILQPLTSLCGVINVINSDRLVVMEKLLAWGYPSNHPTNQNNAIINDKQKYIDSVARACLDTDVHSQVIGSSVQDNRDFTMQDMNSWTIGLACLKQGPEISHKQRFIRPAEDPNQQESCLITKLKELYSTKKTTLRSRTPKSTRKRLLKETTSRKMIRSKVKPDVKEHNVKNVQEKSAGIETTEKIQPDGMQELLSSLDINDESELKKFLHDHYEQALSETPVHSIIKDTILIGNMALREKYEGKSTNNENKLIEYQIQVLLRLEVVASMEDTIDSSLVDEVVVMLRSLSFIKDPGYLRDFLHETILSRYVSKIAKFLCEIYEGLMMNPPDELLSPSKQEEEESPIKKSIVSVVRPESDQPRSDVSRPLTRHRSIADIGGRRREIVIPAKGKSKKSSKSRPFSAQKKRTIPPKTKIQKTPVKKVRRNLFTEEPSEGQDLTRKVKLKAPSIFGKDAKKENRIKRRHSVAAHAPKVVQETPCRKQVSNALWQKQHRARKRASTITEEINVVKESPLKDLIQGENLPRRSPRRHPGSRVFQRSRSFYGGQSCPLVRTRSFTSTDSKSPIIKLDFDAKNTIFDDNNTAQDTEPPPITMPQSPIRTSPRRKSRFTLHNLLTATISSNTRTKKLKTPSKEAPVRSSPRLLKKRSFSFIGFSNSVPLKRSSSTETAPTCHQKVVTPNKETMADLERSLPRAIQTAQASGESPGKGLQKVTPSKRILKTQTRSSPRLNRRNSVEVQPSDNCDQADKIVKTPIKTILRTPTRSSPRLNRRNSVELQPSDNCNQVEKLIKTPIKRVLKTPTRSSPRLLRVNSIDKSHNSDPAKINYNTPRNKLLRTPTRSSPRITKQRKNEIETKESSHVLEGCNETLEDNLTQFETRSSPPLKGQDSSSIEHQTSSDIMDDSNKMVHSTSKKTLPSAVSASRKGENSANMETQVSNDRHFDDRSKKEGTTPKNKISYTKTRSSPRLRRNVSNEKDIDVSSSTDVNTLSTKQSTSRVIKGFTKVPIPKQNEIGKDTSGYSQNITSGSSVLIDSLPLDGSLLVEDESNSSPLFKRQIMDISIAPGNRRGAKKTIFEEVENIVKDLDSLGDIDGALDPKLDDNCNIETKRASLLLTTSTKMISSQSNHSEGNSDRRKSDGDVPSRSRALSVHNIGTRSLESVEIEPLSFTFNSAHTVVVSNTGNPTRQDSALNRISFSPTTARIIANPSDEASEKTHGLLPNQSNYTAPSEIRNLRKTKYTMTAKQCNYVINGQRLLSPKPVVATPPRKKRKTRGQSENENKKSSPLNQILKQRKRTRTSVSKSPHFKRAKIEVTYDDTSVVKGHGEGQVSKSTRCKRNKADVNEVTRHPGSISPRCKKAKFEVKYDDVSNVKGHSGSTFFQLDESSQSSEDMVLNWFNDELENTSKIRTVSDEYSDDSVFKESSSFRRPKQALFQKPVTPISAKSLQMLEESPILSPSYHSSSSFIENSWSDSTPSDVCAQLSRRLKRRKRSNALGQKSSTDENSPESNDSGLRFSKRFKLSSSLS